MKSVALACALLLGWGSLLASAPAPAGQLVAGVLLQAPGASAGQLAELAGAVQQAVADIQRAESLELCHRAVIHVHQDLDSYRQSTGAAWFQLALADRADCRIDLQRLAVVAQHGGIESTVRHELYHLAQPALLERWRAEGQAQRFAGEHPAALPLAGISPAELDAVLAAPASQELHLRAMATALQWVMLGR